MAHAALHFALGMTVGMAVTTPALRRAWAKGQGIAPAVTRWLAASWALGVFAIVPSLLRHAGLPETFCRGWWMNVFMLHPWLTRHLHQSAILGSVAFVGLFVLQYLCILAAILRVRSPLCKLPGYCRSGQSSVDSPPQSQ
jgi:hypothetical protein